MKWFARHYRTGEILEATEQDGRLSVRPASGAHPHGGAEARPEPSPSEGDLPVLAPGFVDLQINGYLGVDFNQPDSLTQEDIRRVVKAQWALGVTHILPTVTSNSFDHMRRCLRHLAQAAADPETGPSIPAIHMEGPYISSEDGPRGAHPKEHARPPDWDEFQRLQEAAEGRIRLVTLSPEYPEAEEFIRRAASSGVAVAIGHTKAASDQIARAVDAGARLSTHLGNGSHAVIPRHPNYIWDQLAADELWASLIVDGHHLPPAVVKVMVRAKSPRRVILVTDAVSVAGLKPGAYTTLGKKVQVTEDGAVRLAGTPYLAGAALEMPKAVANTVAFAGVEFADAVDMASVHPVSFMREHARLPIPHDESGSWVAFTQDAGAIKVLLTAVAGRIVYKAA